MSSDELKSVRIHFIYWSDKSKIIEKVGHIH